VAIGWPLEVLDERLGFKRSALSQVVIRDWVMATTAEKVRAIYDELSMIPGPSDYGRVRAVNRGWVPPLAWDDDTIDDPNAKPHRTTKRDIEASYRDIDEVAVQRALDGGRVTLTLPEREAAITTLVRTTDLSDRQIAERFDGCWPETVLRIRKRHGLRGKYAEEKAS